MPGHSWSISMWIMFLDPTIHFELCEGIIRCGQAFKKAHFEDLDVHLTYKKWPSCTIMFSGFGKVVYE